MRRPETYTARRLRREMTLPEVLLWQQLKSSATGLKFRRQHPIGPYTVDFYCAAARLAVEIDGKSHEMGNRPQSDDTRTQYLEQKGYRIVRLPAVDVLNDPAAAADVVAQSATPLRQSLPVGQFILSGRPAGLPKGDCHLPMNGEDRR